jgi:hypothetical protein
MAKIERPQHVYDTELAEKGLRRIYRIEFTDDFKPIYRELIIKLEEFTAERTPWWKQKAPKSKRSKPSKV